jgi:hypothetical protein
VIKLTGSRHHCSDGAPGPRGDDTVVDRALCGTAAYSAGVERWMLIRVAYKEDPVPHRLLPDDRSPLFPRSFRDACLALIGFLFASTPALAQVEGYGRDATGGAGRPVCTVTSAAASGAGTWDSCVKRGGNQTIQFAIPSVTVGTTSYLRSNTTVDGCANGQNGVTLSQPANAARAVVIEGPVSNVVVRCIRFQGSGPKHSGYSVEEDLLRLDGADGLVSRVVVDRCTFTGSTDGALDVTGDVSDVTLSWNLLYGTPLTQLVKYDTRQRISLHHNVYTANGERNPQIKGDARDIDFVSNAVYNQTIRSDDLGNTFSPYGTLLWNARSGSDSPGNVRANVRSSYFGGSNSRLQIDTESGASAAGVYVAPDNVCSSGGGCPASPAGAPNAVPAAYAVTATPVGCIATMMLPTVGSPSRTTADQSAVNAVYAALPRNCLAVTSISPVAGPVAGGTRVTIRGYGFVAPADVTIGGVSATDVVVAGPSSLTAVTPPHATGLADVTVTIPGPEQTTVAQSFFYFPPSTPSEYYTLGPCRLVDTRAAQGPALAAGERRVWTVTGGACGVPATASALALNVTVTGAAAQGNIRMAPGNGLTDSSTINFTKGVTRANNAIVMLSTDGSGGVSATNRSTGSVHLIVDVYGFFQEP